ncbi:MAG: hypothetical protein MPJ24_03780 [Pirellulaceae bacterium]|nr:hypothetical protein [Pirellulaceae bacterium]
MVQYHLPCDCGETILISTNQAGNTVRCSACGSELVVPTFSKIRQLQAAVDEPNESPQNGAGLNRVSKTGSGAPKKWSRTQGLLFTIGTTIVCLALIPSAYFGFQMWNIHRIYTSQKKTLEEFKKENFSEFYDRLETTTAPELYDAWQLQNNHNELVLFKRASGVNDYVYLQPSYDTYSSLVFWLGILVLIGLTLSVSSFFIK